MTVRFTITNKPTTNTVGPKIPVILGGVLVGGVLVGGVLGGGLVGGGVVGGGGLIESPNKTDIDVKFTDVYVQ